MPRILAQNTKKMLRNFEEIAKENTKDMLRILEPIQTKKTKEILWFLGQCKAKYKGNTYDFRDIQTKQRGC